MWLVCAILGCSGNCLMWMTSFAELIGVAVLRLRNIQLGGIGRDAASYGKKPTLLAAIGNPEAVAMKDVQMLE